MEVAAPHHDLGGCLQRLVCFQQLRAIPSPAASELQVGRAAGSLLRRARGPHSSSAQIRGSRDFPRHHRVRPHVALRCLPGAQRGIHLNQKLSQGRELPRLWNVNAFKSRRRLMPRRRSTYCSRPSGSCHGSSSAGAVGSKLDAVIRVHLSALPRLPPAPETPRSCVPPSARRRCHPCSPRR